MRVRLLGTAAGGAFPQWNCNCPNCHLARTHPGRAKPRSQSSIALSADDRHWFLINASPDIRSQIESFPPLLPQPPATRGTSISAVLLTNADLDHTLGILSLRESGPLHIHATPAVQHSLNHGLNLSTLFDSYCSIHWHEPPTTLSPLAPNLSYAAFTIPGKPPRYRPSTPHSPGDAIGYKFLDHSTNRTLVVLPDLASLTDPVLAEIQSANLLLLDGTFYTNDEMQLTHTGTATAADMGHAPISGPNGTLQKIAPLAHITRVYLHINNTNPILIEDSPERATIQATGTLIGYDGMEFNL